MIRGYVLICTPFTILSTTNFWTMKTFDGIIYYCIKLLTLVEFGLSILRLSLKIDQKKEIVLSFSGRETEDYFKFESLFGQIRHVAGGDHPGVGGGGPPVPTVLENIISPSFLHAKTVIYIYITCKV